MEIRAHGIKITVEEGRSIQGLPFIAELSGHSLTHPSTASAYLTAASFASYTFSLAPPSPPPSPGSDDDDEDPSPYCVFGISLSTVLECLNIFGNATPTGGGKEWSGGGEKKGGRRSGRGEEEIEKKDDGKITSLRMSYSGEGHPLVLL